MAAPSAGNTLLIVGLFETLLVSALELFTDYFSKDPRMAVVGGFLCSFIFSMGVIIMSSLQGLLLRDYKIGWLHVFVALALALVVALTLHPVSFTTCIVFSALQGFYLNMGSQFAQEHVK